MREKPGRDLKEEARQDKPLRTGMMVSSCCFSSISMILDAICAVDPVAAVRRRAPVLSFIAA
jgi:hypothetical protein